MANNQKSIPSVHIYGLTEEGEIVVNSLKLLKQ